MNTIYDENSIIEINENSVFKEIGKHICNEIVEFHKNWSTSVRGELFENFASNALRKMNIDHVWEDGSHKSGADITEVVGLPGVTAFSVKTNKIKNKYAKKAYLSSFRLGRFNSLKEMVRFIANHDSYSHYIFLGKYEKKYVPDGQFKYGIFIFPHDFIRSEYGIDIGDTKNWKEKGPTWVATVPNSPIKLRVNKKMSHQYWIDAIPYDFLKRWEVATVTVNRKEIDNELEK